ncbi:sugar phosphate isomerase/epimerase family protein [Candidatus Viridilinea mediisalina]|uniref:Xylose isomerase-like TIM barrel domain-containing protein n=1 Tax=Candidatus Viridilinea mediisalina TaxID=2024553 RepID=A0A2A6RM73_9CHLR|nr:sugar phosphate isomerase/epimerase family protein [Candidatus Viridilinea mediisalina]PDW04025.1 hypothetical protein CJ255_05485 [Candidatus Viridilinea mediisalina]
MMVTPAPIFVSTACLPHTEPLLARVVAYHNCGLMFVELGARVELDFAEPLCSILPVGSYLIHNYFPPPAIPFVLNLASADTTVYQHSLELVEQALELTAQLGAPFYSVHAGFITDPTAFGTTSFVFPPPQNPEDTAAALQRFISAMHRLADTAQRRGVYLLIENNICSHELVGKLLLQNADEFLQFFQALPHPNLGILLDTGHLNVSAHTLGFDRLAFIEQVAPYIKAFHIHDNDRQADLHQPIQPDSWILEVLKRPEFVALPIVVEATFAHVTALRDHVAWLRGELGRD